jgi:hypothetical protein
MRVVDPIEIDEEHRFVGAVRVRDAGAQPAGHERQVRVGVARLDGALRRVEVLTALETVVLVPRAFGKERPEGLEVIGDPLGTESRGQAWLEKPCCRMAGPVERPGIVGESGVLVGELAAQIDEVETRPRRELDRQVEGLIGHSAPWRTVGPN